MRGLKLLYLPVCSRPIAQASFAPSHHRFIYLAKLCRFKSVDGGLAFKLSYLLCNFVPFLLSCLTFLHFQGCIPIFSSPWSSLAGSCFRSPARPSWPATICSCRLPSCQTRRPEGGFRRSSDPDGSWSFESTHIPEAFICQKA